MAPDGDMGGRTAAPQLTDPLNQVLNGRPAPLVPVAPVYEGLGPLQFHRMELRWRKWQERLQRAAGDLLPVRYQDYLDLELEIHAEILDHYYPPPAWLALPVNMTPDEVTGSAVARRGEELFWRSPDGKDTWIPPHRQAYDDAQVAHRAGPYAGVWEGPGGDEVLESVAQARLRLTAPAETAAQEPQGASEWRGDDVARALLRRYAGRLPLCLSAASPYDGLLGLLGFRGMMCALAERPGLVHHILETSLPHPAARLAALRRLGVGIVFVEECLASADVISPRMYLEFASPYTKQTLQFYEDHGFRTVLYFSGNLMPLLQYLKELPFTALAFEEDRKGYGIDLGEVRRVLGPDRILFGNLDAVFVERASDAEVLAEIRRQVSVAGPGNFVVSLGSPFTPETLLERVRLVCESTQRH